METNRYVAILRAVFDAEDDEAAKLIADKVRENASEDLEEETGDTVDVTQLSRFGYSHSHEEVITRLRQARNLLLRTRLNGSYEMAREVDMFVHALCLGEDRGISDTTYDYSKFMEIANAILLRKEFPND